MAATLQDSIVKEQISFSGCMGYPISITLVA